MATIRKDIHLDVDPQSAWDAVRDYGALHHRLANGFVIASELDDTGDALDRVVTFGNGAVARERLISVDDERRRLVYSVVDSALGFTHHQATVEIVSAPLASAAARHSCTFVWTSDVLPHALAPIIDQLMNAGAAAIARTLSGALV